MESPSLTLVTCWLGPLPAFFPLYAGSARANPTVTFVVATDQPAPAALPPNVRWLPTSLADVNARIAGRLGFDGRVVRGGKLADYKPAFGALFPEAVAGADFWGFCDLDLLWGDVRRFLTGPFLADVDVASFRGPWWLSGALTVLRTATATRLFAEAPGWQATLARPDNTWFDESCYRFDGVERRVADLVAAGEPVSFTDAAREAHRAGRLRLATPEHIAEPSAHWAPYAYRWARGTLTDLRTGEDRLLLHFVNLKHEPFCRLAGADPLPDTVYVTRTGVTAVPPEARLRRAAEGAGRVVTDLPRAARWYGARALSRLARGRG